VLWCYHNLVWHTIMLINKLGQQPWHGKWLCQEY